MLTHPLPAPTGYLNEHGPCLCFKDIMAPLDNWHKFVSLGFSFVIVASQICFSAVGQNWSRHVKRKHGLKNATTLFMIQYKIPCFLLVSYCTTL